MYLKLIIFKFCLFFNTLIIMGMDKYGCFMQYMIIIRETIVNIEHEV